MDRTKHISFWLRHLRMLPSPYQSAETQRMTLAYFCLSALDLLDAVKSKLPEDEQQGFKDWIYAQQIPRSLGGGFRGSPSSVAKSSVPGSTGHLAMTYTALLMLAILRDDFERLDLGGVAQLLAMCQQPDGSFIGGPDQIENDVRFSYCAFAIAAMTGKWDAFDVDAGLRFVHSCQNYDGGFGQGPSQESQGGSTYCSVACFSLAHRDAEVQRRAQLSTWLLHRQQPYSGFNGRAEKPVDTCYSFWCGAALTLLGSDQLADPVSDLQFLMTTQSRIGGFAKTPGEMPDAMHSYMGLAAIALHAERDANIAKPVIGETDGLLGLNPGINLGKQSVSWLFERIQRKVE